MKPLKIIYLSRGMIPSRTANSLHVMKMCQAFSRNGHQVTLAAANRDDAELLSEDPFDFYGVARCFDFHRLARERDRLAGLLPYRPRIHRWVRRQGPDLVYARDHSLRYDLHAIGLPVVLDVHKWIETKKNRRRFEALLASGQLRRVVTNCGALGRALAEEFALPPGLVRAAHNGADAPSESDRAPAEGAAGERLQVGYVGHLYPGKGMEVIAALVRACPWADFQIAGGTDADLAHWRAEFADAPNIFLHGYLQPATTDRFRAGVDVLLAPYQSEVTGTDGGRIDSRWMSPIKLFEYMAAGKAIVASDLPVIREVVADGEAAWLCPPDDLEAWASKLSALRDRPGERRAMGERARQQFLARHTWRARAETVLDGVLDSA